LSDSFIGRLRHNWHLDRLARELGVHSGDAVVIFLQSFDLPSEGLLICFGHFEPPQQVFELCFVLSVFLKDFLVMRLLHLDVSGHIAHFPIPKVKFVLLHTVHLLLVLDSLL
jgi:hypothetical protein